VFSNGTILKDEADAEFVSISLPVNGSPCSRRTEFQLRSMV
jgi:hypothetical protein